MGTGALQRLPVPKGAHMETRARALPVWHGPLGERARTMAGGGLKALKDLLWRC